jgi:hypothetical protein
MDHRSIARISAAGRVAIGVGLLAVPASITRGWAGADGATPGARLLARSLGARDVALGLGVLNALDRGDPSAKDWVRAAAVADTADAVATLLALPKLTRKGSAAAVIVLAAGAAAAGFVAAEHLD